MVSLRAVLTASLLLATLSCADKESTPVPENSQAPNAPTVTPTDTPETPTETIEISPQPITEKFVDAYTSVLIQEIKNQLTNDPLSKEKRIQNVEFANRIFSVDYHYGKKSRLRIVTHTDKVFNFQHTSTEKNVQYFNAYEGSINIIGSGKRTAVYSAEARSLKSAKDNKTVTIIKVKDLESNALVHIIYVKKLGRVNTSFVKGYDYSKELTKISKVFLDRTKENPTVIGEFFAVVTEEKNISNASKFKLTISNNFTLESQPLVSHYRADQPHLIPLSVDYKNFNKSLFFGSAAYIAIKDSSYIIESPRNPVELTALNLDLKIEAKEKIKGQKNTLPIRFFIKFK